MKIEPQWILSSALIFDANISFVKQCFQFIFQSACNYFQFWYAEVMFKTAKQQIFLISCLNVSVTVKAMYV